MGGKTTMFIAGSIGLWLISLAALGLAISNRFRVESLIRETKLALDDVLREARK